MTASGIRSIVVGVEIEEREGPDPVLATASALASALDAELHVVHALESGPLAPPLLPNVSQEVDQAAEALELYLESFSELDREPATRRVALGRAHRVLSERMEEVDADLLVLGPHRGARLPTGGLGTTTDRLLRTARVPCWIARGALELPLRRLAAATDFSVRSHPALDLALALAADLGGTEGSAGAPPPEVEILYVEWPAALRDDPDKEAGELLPRLADEATAAAGRTGLEQVAVSRPRVLAATDPARGLLTHLSRESPDLTLLGTHGRGAVARTLLGSVASVVARDTAGSVVLVPPRESRED
ncbi:MAG: universal stress protein [Gemmatimonadota bacterium]|jgi:nucleotide-binding universal stress UspA family protein